MPRLNGLEDMNRSFSDLFEECCHLCGFHPRSSAGMECLLDHKDVHAVRRTAPKAIRPDLPRAYEIGEIGTKMTERITRVFC